ncbi:hypothetical protein EMIHUDRAFT_449504 [Emiliania huxleyi CCMP1516]|uniref:F-box domain-containing protein n=2 Tax=Emiliania huxleyi TaxID=2903 RepID=A0A0D3K8J7_EMIH1|nr:hypothetical protein EMIHUDRAFT_449504 [Emiliania huxleyi CCMP1516]EOD32082.1 hypothetical protein EMIHUDRAFT_449504 [Emiliania huxleyi CCMP1516]|eukprot:XP_005784511.1 hypothetical protein EMIHUDRAFT_449504 [Emiliania huxleyi CCMP1516]
MRAEFTLLPPELVGLVLSHCTDEALEALACVSSTLGPAVRDNWLKRLKERYPHSPWERVCPDEARRLCRGMETLRSPRWVRTPADGLPPADRGGQASVAVDTGAGRAIVVHGGANGNVFHSDSYALIAGAVSDEAGGDSQRQQRRGVGCMRRPLRWVALEGKGCPSPRWAHSAGAAGTTVALYGGNCGADGALSDLSVLDCSAGEPEAWRWLPAGSLLEKGDRPGRRHSHAACGAPGSDVLWLFGGIVPLEEEAAAQPFGPALAMDASNDLFAAAAGGLARGAPCAALAWQHVSTGGTPPCARAFHASVSVGPWLLVLGGEAAPSTEAGLFHYLSDVHALRLPPIPSPGAAAMALAAPPDRGRGCAACSARAAGGVATCTASCPAAPPSSLASLADADLSDLHTFELA